MPESRVSAGLLMYRVRDGQVEAFLVHPGGPFWRNKDAGAWTIPKGEVAEGEDELATARREFEEETGIRPRGRLLPLGQVKQKGGKLVVAWAFKGDCDPQSIKSNTFTMEWPPGSGKQRQFPEVDRAQFWTLDEAARKINSAQAKLLERLETAIRDAK